MKNVTITLHEDVARWVHLRADEQQTSVSRLIGEMLKQQMSDEGTYGSAMQQYLSRSARVQRQTKAAYPQRSELHDR
jgi:hypothetical protein